MNRRRFVQAVVAGGLVGVAGCNESGAGGETPSNASEGDGSVGSGGTDPPSDGGGAGTTRSGETGATTGWTGTPTATATPEPTTAVWTPTPTVPLEHTDVESMGSKAVSQFWPRTIHHPTLLSYALEVLEGSPLDFFVFPEADWQAFRDVGDPDPTRAEEVAFAREHAVPELSFVGTTKSRGTAELSPGHYKVYLTRKVSSLVFTRWRLRWGSIRIARND